MVRKMVVKPHEKANYDFVSLNTNLRPRAAKPLLHDDDVEQIENGGSANVQQVNRANPSLQVDGVTQNNYGISAIVLHMNVAGPPLGGDDGKKHGCEATRERKL